MTSERAGELLSQNLTAIYGFAFARLYDKDKVEDLSSEIVCEILLSAKNIRDDEAFWGYAWKVAEYTFHKFLRREQRAEGQLAAEASDGCGDSAPSPAEEYAALETEREQLYLLRRELSLLVKTHREICVAYYIDRKSCSQIAKEQCLSVEMVKYHLFKTRKLLKEGIGMTRTLGEKSYNPGVFRLNFWGDRNYYGELFRRKLPGAIALASYDVPMTAQELSMELGVSMPYLEEELEILESAGVIKRTGTKYRTNVVILTENYDMDFERRTKDIYPAVAKELWRDANALLPKIRTVDFAGNSYDENRLLFMILNLAMVNGYEISKERSPIAAPPELPLGSRGWIWGHDNEFKYLHFHGICMQVWNRAETAWFSAVNYRAIDRAQCFDHSGFSEKIEGACDAILGYPKNEKSEAVSWLLENGYALCENGQLKANFPVFNEQSFEAVTALLKALSEKVAACMIEVSDLAAEVLSEHVPEALKEQCPTIAKIHHRLAVAALLMEALIGGGCLTVPQTQVPLCVFGVKK